MAKFFIGAATAAHQVEGSNIYNFKTLHVNSFLSPRKKSQEQIVMLAHQDLFCYTLYLENMITFSF